ncbi:MAG: DEAD/DEAH box helicase family protein, partial [Leptotrichiaceae bacterium]
MIGQNYNFQKVDKRLITNSNDLKFLECLKEEIRTCKSFKFVIAFIKYSGLQLIIEALNQCNEKGIKGEIITSNYLYSTQPYAIKQLMEFKNIDVKIVDVNEFSGGLHAKSYYFEHENNVSIYVGSNNLSKAGLKENTEWILHNFVDMNSEISKRFIYEFEQLRDLSQIPLDRYREMYNENLKRNKEIGYVIDKYIKVDESSKVIVKNSMQLEVLLKLEKLRRDSENKGLVIAATGTGKTYLSAFDAKAFNAKRLLFVVHNKEIAANARKTFEEIFLETRTYGFACDGEFEIDKDFVFALPRTINNNIDKIDENLFDYIIFDEAHRVASDGHQRIYNHFKPKFILGMTATPERMDGKDIYNYFDDNIVSNIRLKNALNNNLLVPFHYFGISDDVEYEASDFNNLREMTRKLNVNKRSEFIINKMEMYGYTAESKRKCLAFCATKEHAVYMCDKFKEKGYNAVILTGESSTIDRSNSIKNLMDENNELEFIFTVDIFNEGVDIPGVNLILMLRPTNSATIFIQQLGRGLRKFKNKEFLTVLDFIGNHSNNYVMTYAFSDGNIYDPSSMRAKIKSGQWGFKDNVHIEIDKKSVDSILESIDKIDFSSKRYLKNMYESFKNEFESNKKIYLRDFLLHSYSPDPLKFTHSKDKNYYDFVNMIEKKEIFSVSPSVRSGINYLMTIAPLR